jgi:hypothetical protein
LGNYQLPNELKNLVTMITSLVDDLLHHCLAVQEETPQTPLLLRE